VKIGCLADDLRGTWKGRHTGHRYRYTETARENWVDRRDVPYLVGWKGPEGEQIFREA